MTGKRDPYYTSPKFIGFCFGEYDRKICADCYSIKACLEMGRKEIEEITKDDWSWNIKGGVTCRLL